MHTLARPLVREHRLHRQSLSRAFTLIELLTVIGIIALLSAITFGVVKGVQERAAIGQAKTELASLSQSLETYKTLYGDYPQTSGGPSLFASLIGKWGPKGSSAVIVAGRSFIDTNRFSLNVPASPDDATNYLLDPWGRAYVYVYYTVGAGAMTKRGYVLYSIGPDNAATVPPADGSILTTATGNADNIYANN